jgi:hypothetical protein
MKMRIMGAAAAIGLACVTLTGCVDAGPGYVSSGYVYNETPYYGGYRDHWRYRERNWDRDRNWDRRPGRPDWQHANDRPDRGPRPDRPRPDRDVRPDRNNSTEHGGRNGWSGDTAGHSYRILPDGQ